MLLAMFDAASGSTVAILLAIGLAAGVIGGLLGVGGSVLMIPALTLIFGVDQHLYQGAAMMVNFFVVVPAVIQHRRARAILPPVIAMTIPAAIVGSLAGVWLSKLPWFIGANQIYLARVFGIFLLYEAGYNLYRGFSKRQLPDIDPEAAKRLPKWKSALLVGLPAGLSGGLLGIGGGAVAVPMQQAFLKMPLRRAIANSAATILLISPVGATYKNFSNSHELGIPFRSALLLAGLMIPSAMVGGYFGGKLTHTIPRKALRIAVAALMLYAGLVLVTRHAPASPVPATQPSPASVAGP